MMDETGQNEMKDQWPIELLVAYADGELTGEEAARAAELVRTDPQAAQIVADMRETARLAAAAFAGPMHEPVPDRLIAAVRGTAVDEPATSGTVVPFARRSRARPAVAGWGMAMAASVALVIGIGGGFGTAQFWDDTGQPGTPVRHAAMSGPDFQQALETAASGVPVSIDIAGDGTSAEILPVLTFRDDSGGICREFQTSLTDPAGTEIGFGVACRTDDGTWRNEVLVAGPVATGDGGTIRTASGGNQARFREIVDSFITDDVVFPDEERALIDGNWD